MPPPATVEQPWFQLDPEQARRLAAAPSLKIEGFVRTPETEAFFASRGHDLSSLSISDAAEETAERAPLDSRRPRYSALASRGEIRALNIDAGCQDEPLRCRLQQIPLQQRYSYDPDLPAYDALSYTWHAPIRTRHYTQGASDSGRQFCPEAWLAAAMTGSAYITGDKDAPPASFTLQPDQVDEAKLMEPVEILIDGKPCDVTGNLAAALSQLRLPDRPRRVWVDAICINQEDVHERSAQVSQMDNIYQGADAVHVWLGPAADGSDRAITLAQALWQYGSVHGCDPMDLLEPPKLEDRANVLAIVENLTILCMRPWFTRRWVFQELVLARSAMVHCGARMIPWRQLAYAVSFLRSHRLELTYLRIRDLYMRADSAKYRRGYLKTLAAETLADVSEIAVRRLPSPGTHPVFERRADLEQLLSNLHALQCTNPLDTVYALLSIASDAETLAIGPPDYNRSVADLYVDVVLRIIETKRSLNILCQRWAGNVGSQSKLPSWIQTFRPAATRHEGGTDNSQQQRRFVGDGQASSFCAAGNHPNINKTAELTPLSGFGQALKVKGIVVDVIEMVSEGAFHEIPASWKDIAAGQLAHRSSDIEARVRSSRQRFLKPSSATTRCKPSTTTSERFAIFADLMTAATRHAHTYRNPTTGPVCEALFADESPYRSNNGAFNIFEVRADPTPAKLFAPHSTGVQLDSTTVHAFLADMAGCTLNRAVARTCNGRLALVDALIPRAEPGDVVAVLLGCDVPVVLRPLAGTGTRTGYGMFELVGEAYVQGLMFGEAVEQAEILAREADGEHGVADILLV